MLRKLFAALLCGVFMCTVVACGSSQSATGSTAANEESSSLEDNSEASSAANEESSALEGNTEASSELPDSDQAEAASDSNLFSFQITIDDTAYTFPMSYQDLKQNLELDGWSADEFGFSSLDVNTQGNISFSRGEEGSLTFWLYNATDASIDPEEGTVVGTACLESRYLDSSVIVLPGGLEFNSNITADTVKSLYGEPADGSTEEILTYRTEDYSDDEVEFQFLNNPEDGSTIVELDMKHYPE